MRTLNVRERETSSKWIWEIRSLRSKPKTFKPWPKTPNPSPNESEAQVHARQKPKPCRPEVIRCTPHTAPLRWGAHLFAGHLETEFNAVWFWQLGGTPHHYFSGFWTWREDFGDIFYGEERCVHGVKRKGRVLSFGEEGSEGGRVFKR